MKTTTSLCFTHEGLVNPEALEYLNSKDISSVVLFGDGSPAALEHIKTFALQQSLPVENIGLGVLPLYEMRVIHPDGTISKPQYVYSNDAKIKWICSKICTHYINISLSDVTSPSRTSVDLDFSQTEVLCYLAHRLWSVMLVAEMRLCFPAIVIDRMIRHTYSLTPETIDISLLKREIGLDSLEYNHLTDLLSVTVAGDIFSVKLSVLNAFYGEFILPMFNKMFGRRIHIQASVSGTTGKFSEPSDMSYGELGRIVEEMRGLAKEQLINVDNCIPAADLLVFAKKARISEETCVWSEPDQSLSDFFDTNRAVVVRERPIDNPTSQDIVI